jgi:TRAP-type C4-dicarboxylate transport system substrate-binding protein
MKVGSVATTMLLIAMAGACTGADTDGGTKAGGQAPPVTLRLGTPDGSGRPSAAQAEEFAKQVEAFSHKRIRIEVVTDAAGTGSTARDWDQTVARKAADGDLDLAIVPSRAFASLGVTSLQALSAPFLVTSGKVLDDVVTGDLSKPLLSGLDKAGLVGLALVPEGLRHPFSFTTALLGPDDYRGKTFRAPTSVTTTSMFKALNATVNDLNGTEFRQAVADGKVAGAESSLALAANTLPRVGVATGNVAFFPKVNVLGLDSDKAKELGTVRLAILRQAAEATRDWAITSGTTEAQAARAYCAAGGTVVLASSEEVGALREAVQPVYAELQADQLTSQLISKITALTKETEPEPVMCSPTPTANSPAASVKPLIKDGIYRYRNSFDYLLAHGMPESEARANAGVFTVTMNNGTYSERWHNATVGDKTCFGEYVVVGPRMFMTWTPGRGCTGARAATATVKGNTLSWTDIQAIPPEGPEATAAWNVFLGVPWTRIGDVQ